MDEWMKRENCVVGVVVFGSCNLAAGIVWLIKKQVERGLQTTKQDRKKKKKKSTTNKQKNKSQSVAYDDDDGDDDDDKANVLKDTPPTNKWTIARLGALCFATRNILKE